MLALVYGLLMLWAVVGFFWSIGGYMNDHNNRYPIPMLLSAAAAGVIAKFLI